MHYIIDGFNLGFADASVCRWIRDGNTDQAIKLIIQKVNQKLKNCRGQIIIVFDGQRGPHLSYPSPARIQIRFSRKPETADDIIRKFIRKVSSPGSWTVVSSDGEIRDTARAMGARVEGGREFLASQKDKSAQEENNNEHKYNPENIDINYWLDAFGRGDDQE